MEKWRTLTCRRTVRKRLVYRRGRSGRRPLLLRPPAAEAVDHVPLALKRWEAQGPPFLSRARNLKQIESMERERQRKGQKRS